MKIADNKLTIQEAFEKFYRVCKIKNLSVETLNYYKSQIQLFSKYYPLGNYCSNFTQEDIYRLY